MTGTMTAADSARLIATARAAHPSVLISDEQLVEYIRVRCASCPLEERAPELLLACAASFGDTEAIRILRREYAALVDAAIRKVTTDAAARDELAQLVWMRLLAPKEPGAIPKIGMFSASGPLRSWIFVVATRLALKAVRGTAHRREVSFHSQANALSKVDVELSVLRDQYAAHFKRAFERAVEELPKKEKRVLRYYVMEGLNIAQIGQLLGVHRATVARWIAQTRMDLLRKTKENIRESLSVDDSEVQSFLRALGSSLKASVAQILMRMESSSSGSGAPL